MSDELERLRQAAARILAADSELAEEVRIALRTRAAAGLIERPDRTLESMVEESPDSTALRSDLETIVSKTGRPVLTIQSDDFTVNSSDVESAVWRGA